MQIIQRIQSTVTSTQSFSQKEVKLECDECRDTGWVLTGTGTYKTCNCVEVKRSKALWENSGINIENSNLRLSNYNAQFSQDAARAKQLAVNYLTNFEQRKDTRENSFGLFGQQGAGKSHIALSIGIYLLKQNIPVVYMPYVETMRELKANACDEEYYNKLINKYARAKVLVIDDLFKDKAKNGKLIGDLTDVDIKHIYPIINYRYLNYLPTVFSTECTINMLLNLDEALAGRILESCGENSVLFKYCKENNYRLRKLLA